MKLSIITITCRANPRLDAMAKTLSGSLAQLRLGEVEIEWIIVDELKRAPHVIPPNENISIQYVSPLPSEHRERQDKRPAHNSARNAGLAAATGDYVVFLNDCTVVTKGWVALVGDVAKEGLGLRSRAFTMNDMVIPEHGAITYRDHHDLLRPVPPTTVAGACWGAPSRAFQKIHGFDRAYDGESKGHDVDAIIRLSRVGVKFVSSERAFVIVLRRTKTKNEVARGNRNQHLLNQLQRDANRTQPTIEAGQIRRMAAIPVVEAKETVAATAPPGPPRRIDDAAYPPQIIDDGVSDPLLDAMDD